jgi:CheY-like chemotaxis protein
VARPLCILVVDDHTDSANSLARLFGREGYVALTSGSAAEALACAAGLRVDVLVSDIALPDIDGCELLRRLRDLYGRDVPAVAITGLGEAHHIEECRRAGYSQSLLKPVLFPQVIEAVKAALAGREMADTA